MKTIEGIYREMKEDCAARTGLVISDDGDMALRLHAAAAQLYALWVNSDFVARQAFPQTADGEYLDMHAQMRGLERGAALKASGTLRFSCPTARVSALAIGAGVRCSTNAGAQFETLESGSIAIGATYCDVAAVALAAGASGNAPAASIVNMTQAPTGVSGCSNPAAFSGGADAEDDDSLRERVLNSYRRLPNGANAAYYEATVLGIDGVGAVTVLPKNRGVGTVDIIVASNEGLPSQTLVGEVQTALDEGREICVDIEVSAPTAVSVNVAAQVQAAEGYSFAEAEAAVEQAVEAYFSGALLGKNVLRAKLGSIIYGVDGVENYSITSPSEDMTIDADELPVLGTLSITQLGA